jgi:hypothetical protein
VRLLVAFVVWLGAIAGAAGVSSVVASGIHSGSGSGGSSAADATNLTAASKGSMFQTASFTTALNSARSHVGAHAEISNFVIYPGYLSVESITPGTQTDFTYYAGGTVDSSTDQIDTTGQTAFPLADIDATAPAAIASLIETKAHVPLAKLHYMVASTDPISGKFSWIVYLVPGSGVEYYETAGARGPLQAETGSGLQTIK